MKAEELISVFKPFVSVRLLKGQKHIHIDQTKSDCTGSSESYQSFPSHTAVSFCCQTNVTLSNHLVVQFVGHSGLILGFT